MAPTQIVFLTLPEHADHTSKSIAVAVLLSLFIHAVILLSVSFDHWSAKLTVAPISQTLIVTLQLNAIASDEIPMTEVTVPLPPEPTSTSSTPTTGHTPTAVVKIDPERVDTEKSHTTPSETAEKISVVVNPSPTIDLEAAYRIAREVGRISEEEETGSNLHRDDDGGSSNNKIRLAVVSAWSPPPSCYRAYSGMGLFAIPFLLKDTITNSGCEW